MENCIDSEVIKDFFALLNRSGISYVLIKNIDNELPDSLPDGKDIDILVKEEEIETFQQIMENNGFDTCIHPVGRENGWQFLYGLPEYQKWKKANYEKTLYIDVSFRLSCKSLMPKTWAPLDASIQKRIWKERFFDADNQWWIMDYETRFAYYLFRCVFDKQVFSEEYIREIEKSCCDVDMSVVNGILRMVFFNYTDRLMDLVKERKYGSILQDYISFSDY